MVGEIPELVLRRVLFGHLPDNPIIQRRSRVGEFPSGRTQEGRSLNLLKHAPGETGEGAPVFRPSFLFPHSRAIAENHKYPVIIMESRSEQYV